MVSKTQLRILRRSSVGSCNSGARLVPILGFKAVGMEAWWKTVAPFRSVNVGDDDTSLLPMRRSLQSEMGMDTIGDSAAYVGRGIERPGRVHGRLVSQSITLSTRLMTAQVQLRPRRRWILGRCGRRSGRSHFMKPDCQAIRNYIITPSQNVPLSNTSVSSSLEISASMTLPLKA